MRRPLIRGAGGGGGGSQRAPVEAPDSLHSVARAKLMDLLSEGEVFGPTDPANPLSCVFYNETPVANDDGSLNFRDVQVDWRHGTQDQSYIKGFAAVENEVAIGVELTDTAPWTRAITDLELSAIRVTLRVGALKVQDLTSGDVKGCRIEYAIDLAIDGGAFTEMLTAALDGKTNSLYERSHRVDLPDAATGWTLRLRRITPNSSAANIADETFVGSYTEIVDGKFRYPNSAVVAHQVDAEQFSSVPTRAYDWKGRIIQVPSNYDPETRVYTGIWDGTFTSAWSDNPAWVFYDLVLNDRYGLGHLVSAAQIDKWGLYEIGQYCDELVPNGNGGTEPRMTCNVYLQTRADAYRVLTDLASCFRGMAYWGAGQIMAVQDAPSDPVYPYAPGNVIDGRFSYAGTGRRARHTVAMVAWNDLNDFGRQKIEPVHDEEAIALYGVNQTDVVAFGCTSRGQAIRAGRHILATERYENDTVNFSVGLDGTIARPGQVIQVADPLRAGRRLGGRVSAATATTVNVDQMPDPAPAAGDTLVVVLPSGVAQTRVVDSVAADTITVTVAFDAVPVAHSIWAVESESLRLQQFRVLDVREGDGLTHVITALKHEPDKYDYIDTEDPVEPLATWPSLAVQGGVTDLTVSAVERAGGVHVSPFVVVEWTAPAGAVRYEVQWRRSDGEWSPPERTRATRHEIEGAFAGSYRAKVVAFNSAGIASTPQVSAALVVADQTLKPTAITNLEGDAGQALEQLADIASDDILTQGEKPAVILQRDVLVAEQAGLDAQATAFGITTEKTAYDNAVSALTTYLATLTTPVLWSNLAGDTTIVGTTFRGKFADVYTTKQALIDAIVAKGKTNHDGTRAKLDLGMDNDGKVVHGLNDMDRFVDGTLFRRPGAGYVDGSGRVVTVWDDETGVPRTGGYVGGAASRARAGLDSAGDVARDVPIAKLATLNLGGTNLLTKAQGAGTGVPVTNYAGWLSGWGYVLTGAGGIVVGQTVLRAWPKGEDFTVSFAAYTAAGSETLHVDLFPDTLPEAQFTVDTDYTKRYAFTINSSHADMDSAALRFFADPASDISVTDIKVEHGNKATRWSPAPLDVEVLRRAGFAGELDADKTSVHTAADTALVAGSTASTVRDGANKANTGLDAVGKLVSGYNEIDRMADSATFRKVGAGYADSSGRIYKLLHTTLGPIDGSLIIDNASAGKGASDDLTATPEFDRTNKRVTGFQGEGALARKGSVDFATADVTNKASTALADTADLARGGDNITRFGGRVLSNIDADATWAKVGTGYADAFGRVNALWDGAILRDGASIGTAVSRATSGLASNGDVARDVPSALVKYPSGQTIDALKPAEAGATSGREKAANGSFAANTVGATLDVRVPAGGMVADNWLSVASMFGGAFVSTTYGVNGTNALVLAVAGNIPAATALFDQVNSVERFRSSAGKKYRLAIDGRQDYAIAIPSGVDVTIVIEARCYTAAGVENGPAAQIILGPREAGMGGTYAARVATGTAPANTATIGISAYIYVNNTTGVEQVVGGCAQQGFDNVSLVEIADLDNEVADGSAFARIAASELSAGVHKLQIAGSGNRLGNAFNQPLSQVLGYGAVRSATALTASSTGTVAVNAHDVTAGGAEATYNANATAVTGLTQGVTYSIYTRDNGAGGSPSWTYTTSSAVANSFDDSYTAGVVVIPTSGTSGGGGGGIDPGECVCDSMFIREDLLAGDAAPGDLFDCLDLPTSGRAPFRRRLESVDRSIDPCVRITSDRGAVWEGSVSTPFDLPDGRVVFALHMHGETVITDLGEETVVDVEGIGLQPVSHCHLGGVSYAAGANPTHRIFSHNPIKP